MMRRIWKEFDETLFGYGSPVTLGLFRIVFCALVVIGLSLTATNFSDVFTERGLVPAALAERWTNGIPRLNVLSGVTAAPLTAAVIGTTILAAFCAMMGLGTRVATIVMAIGIVSLHHRNPFILNSGDTLMRVTAIYLAVSPCGRACSLDRVIGLWRGTAPTEHAPISLWPQRLIQIQLSVVYFFTVLLKWGGNTWRDGTATWYPPQLAEFARFGFPPFFDQGIFLRIGTYGTLLIELALATLVWSPRFRKWVLLGGLGLHAIIEWRFNIPMFAFVIVSLYICHYEGHEVKAWAERLSQRFSRFRVNVAAPEGRKWREAPARALTALGLFGTVEYGGSGNAKPAAAWARSPGAWLALPVWKSLLFQATEEAPARKTKGRP